MNACLIRLILTPRHLTAKLQNSSTNTHAAVPIGSTTDWTLRSFLAMSLHSIDYARRLSIGITL